MVSVLRSLSDWFWFVMEAISKQQCLLMSAFNFVLETPNVCMSWISSHSHIPIFSLRTHIVLSQAILYFDDSRFSSSLWGRRYDQYFSASTGLACFPFSLKQLPKALVPSPKKSTSWIKTLFHFKPKDYRIHSGM